MRNIFSTLLLLLALLAGLPGRAQEQASVAVHLRWGQYASLPAANATDAPRRVPTFEGATHGAGEVVGTYALRVAGTVSSGQLQDAVYEPFAAADLRLLGSAKLPDAPDTRLRFGTEARQAMSYVLLRPVRRNPQTGQAERLVSFNYVYQLSAAPRTAARGTAATAHTKVSVLATGDWYKIGVPASGVYKLDKAALQSLGLSVSGLDPRKVQLYGNGTGILPQPNATPRPDDLVENNIYFKGDGNATLDDGEYFLFYARGPHVWRESQPTNNPFGQPGYTDQLGEDGRWKHLNNIYCDTAYYFVRVGSQDGRRVPAAPVPTAAPSGATITTFLDRRYYEHDLSNVLHSGRRWLGEPFNSSSVTSRDFVFSGDGQQPLADLVAGDTLRLTSSVATTALANGNFTLALNGRTIGSQQLQGILNGYFTAVAQNTFNTFVLTTPSDIGSEPKVTLSFTSGDAGGTGYLDYLELVVKRQLRLSGSFLEFNSLNNKRGAGTAATYTVGNAGGALLWDVTNPRRAQSYALDGGGSFVAPTDTLREFVAVQPGGSFAVPRLWGHIANQNLHALNTDGKLDLVIVTYPPFAAEAERLAQHRRDYDGLTVAVATTRQIYNEFSSGGQDVTAIRDLMKMVYDRDPDPAARRLNLLLLGDASYDYKSSPYNEASQEPAWWAQRTPFRTTNKFDEANQNFVPTYESRESFQPVSISTRLNLEGTNSYSSEDYYGLLDDSEGAWIEADNIRFESVDIGVGRLPVRTPIGARADASQAAQVVNKLLDYDAPASFGKWRNRITLTADDTDVEKDNGFVNDSESLFAKTISTLEPAYNLRKDYLDLFPQVSAAAGQRSPACVAAIDESLEQGSLLIGYIGHGGPNGLADEQIITRASLLGLQNQHRLTFFVTGTCDLSTYDNPDLTSAGELVLTDNATGGAVGLFTTSRVALSGPNTALMKSFYAQAIARMATGLHPILGQAVSTAKNNVPGGDLNNRNYTLLGDPSSHLAYPKQRVVLDSIAVDSRKANPATSASNVLQALSQVRVTGHIENAGALNNLFGGTAYVSIYDKADTTQTLGDQGSARVPVVQQESVIYDGQATVSGGRFSVSFVVPKDIAYRVGLGKISLYAADMANQVDAQGYLPTLVGGASQKAPGDTTPPVVQLYLTDETFVSGGVAASSPLFIAHLSDDSGINTSSSGIGHDITATLDNDASKLLTLNDAYTTDKDTYKSGRVRYTYKDLAVGPHTIKLKAWDTYNNSSERTVDFLVEQSAGLALDHVLNYPNPFSNLTTFHFDQNHAGEELDVQVQVFTVTGHLVKTLRATFPSSTAHVPSAVHDPQLTWDGRDDYGDQLARGVYVYRVAVRLPNGGQSTAKYEKLVLLN